MANPSSDWKWCSDQILKTYPTTACSGCPSLLLACTGLLILAAPSPPGLQYDANCAAVGVELGCSMMTIVLRTTTLTPPPSWILSSCPKHCWKLVLGIGLPEKLASELVLTRELLHVQLFFTCGALLFFVTTTALGTRTQTYHGIGLANDRNFARRSNFIRVTLERG